MTKKKLLKRIIILESIQKKKLIFDHYKNNNFFNKYHENQKKTHFTVDSKIEKKGDHSTRGKNSSFDNLQVSSIIPNQT